MRPSTKKSVAPVGVSVAVSASPSMNGSMDGSGLAMPIGLTLSANGNGSNPHGSRKGNIVNSRVLLLNQNYEPLCICTARRALVMAFSGVVQVVEKHESLGVRTVSAAYCLPTVIRLERYVRRPTRRALLNRKNLLTRDGHRCQYCNKNVPNLTIDHIVPRRFGGEDTWENLVTACAPCNSKKGHRTPEQAGLKLLRRPKRPDQISFIRQSARGVHNSWRPYLFMD